MVIHEQGDGMVSMLRNPKISMRTKGLLAYLSKCPESVTINYDYIVSDMTDGIAGVRASVLEAERHGYLRREQLKNRDKFGEWVWTVRI